MRVPPHVLGITISGIGLILFGIAAAFLLPAGLAANDPTVPTDFSAIPARVRLDAPVLALNDIYGVEHSLSDYEGRVVLVNLWATWCPPCKAEMPNLQNYYVKYRDEGLAVVAIDDGEPKADVVSFANEFGLTFPIWLDPTYQATDHAFKTMNLPSSYVIDRAGKIRLAWVGAISEKNLEKYVTPIIKE
jgi:cytochrome c biogenesis protein CcmG/thiol:disulfide interchange protein DsbE